MKIEQLSNFLDKKFSVKGMLDLADLSKSPQAAYKFFYSVYQSKFANNDRIVLYTSEFVSDELLQHLYQAASFVDISNWFVLICTKQDISHQLKAVAKKYSSDLMPFQHFTISIEQTSVIENNFYLPDTICAIPWMHLEIRNNGDITPCCVSDNSTIGNITSTTLTSAFYSNKITSLRNRFLAGEKPDECAACWSREGRGLSSTRTHNIKRLKKEFLFKQLDQPSITSLDIKFNNTCNFKCRICSPTSSSLIAAEHKKFFSIPIEPQANWSESTEFINQLETLLPELTNIDMYGGEPFLIKKFVNVLRTAVEQDHAKNIRLHYNSNGSIWPEVFLPYWPHFKEVDIHFSIDDVGPRFSLQRGSSWQEVEDNILKIKNLNLPNLNISLMPTISIMNIYYLDDVYKWANKHGFKLFAGNVVSPWEFALPNLTKEAQQLVLDKFQNHPWDEIQKVLALIRSTPPSDGKTFVHRIKWFDTIRQENFAESHSEIAKAMGYVYNNNL